MTDERDERGERGMRLRRRIRGRSIRAGLLPVRCPVCWTQFMIRARTVPNHWLGGRLCSGSQTYGRCKRACPENGPPAA